MFNSQSQQILAKYFLLLLHLQHLHSLPSPSPPPSITPPQNPDTFLSDRIAHLQQTITMQLKQKQQKLHQLNSYIKQLHSQNQQISGQYKLLLKKHQQLQQTLKNQQTLAQSITPTLPQEHQYHLTLLQKQKQQLNQQINRLTNITVKQLQADIQILNKQNQSHISSINNYRIQQTKSKTDKIKLQQQIKHLTQYIKAQKKKEQQIKMTKNKQQQKFQQQQKKNKKQIDKIIKNYINTIQQLKQKYHLLQNKFNQQSKLYQINLQTLQKKSKKLRQYDQQYNLYLNKMNNLNQQILHLKHQSTKIKQQYETTLKNQKQKSKTVLNKILQQTKNDKNNLLNDFSNKNKIFQSQLHQEKQQITNKLHKQIANLKQTLSTINKQHQHQLSTLTKQKQSITKQWQQLLLEMGKQKTIINQLFQQLQNQRKTHLQHQLSQCHTNKPNDHPPTSYDKQLNSKLITHSLLSSTPSQSFNKPLSNDQYKDKLTNKIISQQPKSHHGVVNENNSTSMPYTKISKYNISQNQLYQPSKTKKHSYNDNILSIPQQPREQISTQLHQIQSSQQSRQSRTNTNSHHHKNTDKKFQYLNALQKYQQNNQDSSFQNDHSNSLQNTAKNPIQQPCLTSQHDILSRRSLNQQFQPPQSHRQKISSLNQITTTWFQNQDPITNHQLSKPSQNTFNNYKQMQQRSRCFFKDIISSSDKTNYQKQLSNSSKIPDKYTNERQRSISSINYYGNHQQSTSIQNSSKFPQQKLMKSSSLNKVNIDSHLNQIQKYLTFDLLTMKQQKTNKNIFKSPRANKLQSNSKQQSSRLKLFYGIEPNQTSEKHILIQKINKIQSYRTPSSSNPSSTKLNSNLYKRSPNQGSSKINSIIPKQKNQKQNTPNSIISRNYPYLNQP